MQNVGRSEVEPALVPCTGLLVLVRHVPEVTKLVDFRRAFFYSRELS